MAHYHSICIAGVRPVTGAGGYVRTLISRDISPDKAYHICTLAVHGFWTTQNDTQTPI
jgi:hypothetical protein